MKKLEFIGARSPYFLLFDQIQAIVYYAEGGDRKKGMTGVSP